jgi:hypothetical protein
MRAPFVEISWNRREGVTFACQKYVHRPHRLA